MISPLPGVTATKPGSAMTALPGIGAATAPSAARATALGSISGIVEEPELESLELDGSSAAPRSTARRDAIVDVRPARPNKRARDANRFIDPKSMRGRMIAWLKQRLNCAARIARTLSRSPSSPPSRQPLPRPRPRRHPRRARCLPGQAQ
jgi:hypothetical protein